MKNKQKMILFYVLIWHFEVDRSVGVFEIKNCDGFIEKMEDGKKEVIIR